jgi:hypothetical protein
MLALFGAMGSLAICGCAVHHFVEADAAKSLSAFFFDSRKQRKYNANDQPRF